MKEKLLSLLWLIATATCFSTKTPPLKLTTQENAYFAGDSLYKYQIGYKDPGSKGKELTWDFSHVHIIRDNYLLKYFHPNRTDTTRICGMEHRTRYYYRQQNDSLWTTGFENYTTLMRYTRPELRLKFPFTYGDTLCSQFEGNGIYSNLIPLKVKGYTRTEADAEGTLKLPNGKVINRALRLYSNRHYTQTGKDSLQMMLEIYSWYAQGIRYPIFESIKTTIRRSNTSQENNTLNTANDTTVFRTSFYYTPEELEVSNTHEEQLSEIERVFTEASMMPNPIENDLQIRYKLTRPAVIWFSVHNSLGMPIRQTTQRELPQGHHHETIPMSGLITGTYTVYVHVDDMILSRVVVKR